jgi:pyruvate dehydrogenase E1 component
MRTSAGPRRGAGAFRTVNDARPTCFIAYVKGYGLPLAGHKDNHAGR